ncbi:MAG: HEAT repeat domain-containing protein [Polyangiaceae bacterium]|nr:HEAT repeat domain-containing protein [Polyangiaceae bacterium]
MKTLGRSALRRLSGTVALGAALWGASCTAPAIGERTPNAVVTPPVSAAPTTKLSPAHQPAPLSYDEALARGREIVDVWKKDAEPSGSKVTAWAAGAGIGEGEIVRVLVGLTRPCLNAATEDVPECKKLFDSGTESEDKAIVEVLAPLLGELGDPSPHGSETFTILGRLDARGLWRGEQAIGRLLERRKTGGGTCAPPTAEEIANARASLDDFAVIVSKPRKNGGPKAEDAVEARAPTAAELDDLAYFRAAVGASGAEVGTAKEDSASKPLVEGDPVATERARLYEAVKAARNSGDFEAHLRAGKAYLEAFGYPAPMRLAEERDRRWGGLGVSFVMRDVAMSAEILGRFDLAEDIYRRAAYRGGFCGTSWASYRDYQIRGLIRTAEVRRGCRAAVAERLFSVGRDRDHRFDTAELASKGFDVARLYRGAMLTAGRDMDSEALRKVLAASPLGGRAVARLEREGSEDWARRVRAVGGFVSTAGAAGVDSVLAFADKSVPAVRAEAIGALGYLLEDRGTDVCGRMGWGVYHGSQEREVKTIMNKCDTRLGAARMDEIAKKVASHADDTSPAVREAVAKALGNMGRSSSRPVLNKLARDTFENGGTTCINYGTPQEKCEPTRQVRFAARTALERLQQTETERKTPPQR